MTVDGELVPRGVMQVNLKEALLSLKVSDVSNCNYVFTGICAPRHGESHLIDIFETIMFILKYQINPIYIKINHVLAPWLHDIYILI